METKRLGSVEIKDADQGLVTALFSRFDVKDHDGDVTVKGAFQNGAPVRISAYNHTSWSGSLPVGKGVIEETGDGAILKGEFFMNTALGRDTFEVVKQLGELGEWSYGFDITAEDYGDHEGERVRFIKGVQVHEVSPVLRGAGIDTRTLTAKSAGLRLSDDIASVVAEAERVIVRAEQVMATRQEKGKGLGIESSKELEKLAEVITRLNAIVTAEPNSEIDDIANQARLAYMRFVAQQL